MFNWNFIGIQAGVYLLILWETFWKATALWKAAKKGDKLWFIAIFVVNFFGLIPIFYLWKTKQLKPTLKEFQDFFKSKFHK